MTQPLTPAEQYAANIAIQMRKGFLAYCVMRLCREPMYTSDIIESLRQTELVVVEGTIYPLLSRLQKDGLLEHEWRESELGPPRKYYRLTSFGQEVMESVMGEITTLNTTLKKL